MHWHGMLFPEDSKSGVLYRASHFLADYALVPRAVLSKSSERLTA